MELQNFALIFISILNTSRSFLIRTVAECAFKQDVDRTASRRRKSRNNKRLSPSHVPVAGQGDTFGVEPNLLPVL
jgi:hypothetical protein